MSNWRLKSWITHNMPFEIKLEITQRCRRRWFCLSFWYDLINYKISPLFVTVISASLRRVASVILHVEIPGFRPIFPTADAVLFHALFWVEKNIIDWRKIKQLQIAENKIVQVLFYVKLHSSYVKLKLFITVNVQRMTKVSMSSLLIGVLLKRILVSHEVLVFKTEHSVLLS